MNRKSNSTLLNSPAFKSIQPENLFETLFPWLSRIKKILVENHTKI